MFSMKYRIQDGDRWVRDLRRDLLLTLQIPEVSLKKAQVKYFDALIFFIEQVQVYFN
jgi:hypothetical protein